MATHLLKDSKLYLPFAIVMNEDGLLQKEKVSNGKEEREVYSGMASHDSTLCSELVRLFHS